MSRSWKTSEVWEWPEFRAFARRLGVALDLKTTVLNVNMSFETNKVEVTQTYIPKKSRETANRPESPPSGDRS